MKISIIIAAYNVEKYIEKCVNSVLQQNIDFDDYEIVIVNDGSTDNTFSILESFEKKYSNIKIINQENSGLGASRNVGLTGCSGDFIWFIDGDDYIEKNCLKNIFSAIEKNQLDVLVLNYSIVDYNYQILNLNCNVPTRIDGVLSGSEFYKNNFSKSYSFLFIFKKELFEKNNIIFKDRINMQDSEILPKLMYHTQRLAFLKNTCYYYVQHCNSFTNSLNSDKRYKYFESIIEVRNSLEEFLREAKDDHEIIIGINKKINALHEVVFNHLIFFKYEKNWLFEIIQLLKENNFYPVQYNAKGKLKLVKFGLNTMPFLTKKVIDLIKK